VVPKGWAVKSIGDISEILNGHAFKSEDYVDEDSGIFVLRTTNFSDDGYAKRLSKDVFLPNSFLNTHSKYICEPFDFHLVMVGASVGRTSTLLPHMLPALRNQNMWCFRSKNGFLSKFFIHETVKLKIVEALMATSGSAREFLRKSDFQKSLLTLPSESLLVDFEDRVAAIKNKIAVNENQLNLLMNIRDNLLPRLISGRLRLPDAEEAGA
jgi:type I restriction enzyme S subunit